MHPGSKTAKTACDGVNVTVPFNRPTILGKEIDYVKAALVAGHLSGNGPFTKQCQAWLESKTGCAKSLLTHSATAALELAALLLGVACGDEVIMPSFAFVSTANAFVLRGATPVFVDIQDSTLNIDPALIERAITTRTKAIVALHYAGVACNMDAIGAIASRYGVPVVEDAAQAVLASYHGKPLGGIGALGAFSFHETKNITSGEGGALLVNDPRYASRAEVLWEKGTDRSRFARGEVEKYTWVDVGSSYLPSELVAAFLLAQLEQAESVTMNRLRLWQQYHDALEESEHAGKLRRPFVPEGYGHNAHIYCIRVGSIGARRQVLQELREAGIEAAFHYVPLHSSPAGRRFGRSVGDLQVTTVAADRIIRLPLWDAMTDAQLASVVTAVKEAVARI